MGQSPETGIRLNKKGKPSILHWRGLMHGLGTKGRAIVFAVICIFSASLAFTQLGFIGVGMQGDYIAYGVLLLAPIAFGVLALGVFQGTLLGFVGGVLLFAHSELQPLDYYEMSFISPTSSIVLFTFISFLMALLMALALRNPPSRTSSYCYLAVVCVIVSVLFTVCFSIDIIVQIVINLVYMAFETGIELDGTTAQAYAIQGLVQFGNPYLQMGIDALLMFASCIACEVGTRKGFRAASEYKLGTKFRAWLVLVVSLVFVVTAGTGFVVITEQAKSAAEENMKSEISYLESQLEAFETRNGKLRSFLESDAKSEKAISEDEGSQLENVFSIESLLKGYTKEADGTIVIFKGDTVVLSDDPSFRVGSKTDDYLGLTGLQNAFFVKDLSSDVMTQVAYDENLLMKDDMKRARENGLLMRNISTQMAFICLGEYEDYTIMIITPAEKVFATRTMTMAWVTIAAFVLLVAVYTMVSKLLTVIVVRRIDETNEVLGEITDGNLDARVDIRDSREFASLSTGINTTVTALKGWIGEAEERMASELATAKAIQESALPRTFPPYPDIHKFDVFATMHAAREVGGDFYDFFLIGDDSNQATGKLGFVIADVSGKGVPAALFMMEAKTQLRGYLASGMEPGEAVENANRQLCDGNENGMFVTAWVGVLDYATGHVDYVNAGHNPPLLWSSLLGDDAGNGEHAKRASWRWLTDISGLPLGLFDGLPYESFSVDCQIGDQFLLYTDGVTEAISASGELYGEERLQEIVDKCFTCHPRVLVSAVRRDVSKHAKGAVQSDDITMLALEVGVPPETTATISVPATDKMLPIVNEFIHTELDRRLCPLRAQKQLDVAVEELFVNVCHYAYGGEWNESDGVVRIGYTYSAEPPSVQVTIADDGAPYNPLAKPDAITPDDIMEVPIGGLGILMAKKSVDSMSYERVGKSNVVTIVKKW